MELLITEFTSRFSGFFLPIANLLSMHNLFSNDITACLRLLHVEVAILVLTKHI